MVSAKPVSSIVGMSDTRTLPLVQPQDQAARVTAGMPAPRLCIEFPYKIGKRDITQPVRRRLWRKPSSFSVRFFAPVGQSATHVHTEYRDTADKLRPVVEGLDISVRHYRSRGHVANNSCHLERMSRGHDEGRTCFHERAIGHDPALALTVRDKQHLAMAVAPDPPGKYSDLLQLTSVIR